MGYQVLMCVSPTMWLDLAKICLLVKTLKVLGDFSNLFNWSKLRTYFDNFLMLLGTFSLLQSAKYWKNNLAIWSLWRAIIHKLYARSSSEKGLLAHWHFPRLTNSRRTCPKKISAASKLPDSVCLLQRRYFVRTVGSWVVVVCGKIWKGNLEKFKRQFHTYLPI